MGNFVFMKKMIGILEEKCYINVVKHLFVAVSLPKYCIIKKLTVLTAKYLFFSIVEIHNRNLINLK